MTVFAYKAADVDASEISGTIVADSPRQARDLLRDRSLTVHQMVEVASQTNIHWWNRRGSASRAKLTGFFRELSTLLAVGIPLLEAIDTLAEQYTGRLRATLLMLRERIAAGSSLADAMGQQPAVFDELSVIMTEVGEDSGSLETTLGELGEFRQRGEQVKGRIATAALYPCIVLMVGLAVTIFLMTYVVPGLLSGLAQAGKPLPAPTRIVKAISDFLIHHPAPLLTAVAGLIVGVVSLMRTGPGRRLWHRSQLRIPILGELIRKQAIARIAVIVSTLMRSGLVFLRGLQVARRATRNRVLADALGVCEKAVQAGQDISESLATTGAFPPMVVKIFSVGQQSGRLEEMLDRLAEDYDRQVATTASRFTSVLEPVLIILLAILVGFVALATILPLLEAGNVL